MTRSKTPGLAIWLALFTCLSMGVGSASPWPVEGAGVQVLVVIDVAAEGPGQPAWSAASQAVALLAHLLKEQDYLGLAVSAEQAGLLLPPGPMKPAHRQLVLRSLNPPPKGKGRKPLSLLLPQALELFAATGPKSRALVLLTDAAEGSAPRAEAPAAVQALLSQVQAAGVRVYAASVGPPGANSSLRHLASASGGRVVDLKAATEFSRAILQIYQSLAPRQEIPLEGERFLVDPWVEEIVVAAARATAGKGVLLTSPRGSRLSGALRVPQVNWVSGQQYDLITISRPQAGVWTLSQAHLASSRVFVSSALTLRAPALPPVIGQDEILPVKAALAGPGGGPKMSELLPGTLFIAELSSQGGPSVTVRLQGGSEAGKSSPPEEFQVEGHFLPPHSQGEATLKIQALGKTFQRLVSLPLVIGDPWYRTSGSWSEEKGGEGRLRFQPAPDRPLEGAQGAVMVRTSQGGVSGVFVHPAPGGEIVLARPSGCPPDCRAELHLRGSGPGGRPLDIASIALAEVSRGEGPKNTSASAPPVPPAKETPPPSPPKAKRRWFWLALSGLGLAVFLASAVLLFLSREKEETPEGAVSDTSPKKGSLSLKAQVEALVKEKTQLQEALKEAKAQIDTLQAEKSQLQENLERLKEKSQSSVKSIEDLQKKLEEAEKEAQGIRQEYMALYARSQQEKELLKKN